MLRRCDSETQDNYKFYGAKGIRVEERWHKFENFRDDMYALYLEHSEKYGDGNTSIDRISNKNNYGVDNCRWATMKQQQRNRSNNRTLEYNGETKSLAAWADESGLTYAQLKLRLRRGWSIEKALTTGRLINQYSIC